MNNAQPPLTHDLLVDDVECEAIMLAWEYSSSVLVLQGSEERTDGVIQCINRGVGSYHKMARIDTTFPADEASFATFLMDNWGLSQGQCAGGDLAALVGCIEKSQRIGARYLLQVSNAEALVDEHWQLLRILCQLGGGLFGVMLGGRQLEERCEKFLIPFGISCLYHHLSNRASASSATSAKDAVVSPDPSPSPDKSAPWYRNPYVIMMTIALLTLLFFQQKINQWISSPQPIVAEPEALPGSIGGSVVIPDGIEKELPLKEQVVTSSVVILSPVGDAGYDMNGISVGSKAADAESVSALADVAVAPVPVVDEPKPAPVVSLKEDSKLKTENWILSQSSQDYTLHVMSVRNEQRLRKLIADKKLEDRAAYYQAKRKSGTWFVLLIGRYSDESKAKKDIPALEKQLGVKGILLRKFEYSQKDIVASRS